MPAFARKNHRAQNKMMAVNVSRELPQAGDNTQYLLTRPSGTHNGDSAKQEKDNINRAG